jgi:hypothetical protein
VLVRFFGEFVRCQMVSFAVGDGSGGVGVRREVVQFRGSIMDAR